ncbi:threonine/homoserine/homoserine lactone efflux protein [Palleronia aestuarii]|uniref:Threonine/homoserine/homoserine lactone efflux protein n=1 Tax=Palleronia aestuarii TaxID=568105 RepID=A0A2W7N8L2_9RHOB|nr:LysE family translocator [Palleronia aestuarii]PZX16521.1 threonine/homoserine/homoserine lactone efflux protein [Palleronia aestuarii]
MLAFAAAVFFLIVTPGPGVMSVAGVGSAYGFRAAMSYVAGLFVGHALVSLAVITGLSAIVLGVPWVRDVLMAASISYLLYLAGRIAFAGSKISFLETRSAPGPGAGIALQAINPKAYAVNTALFTGFAFQGQSFATETVLKLLILNVIWIPIHLAWLWAGVTLRRLDLSPRAQRAINFGMAAAMLAVVALAIFAALRTR